MLRTILDARTLLAMAVALAVGVWGLRTYPVQAGPGVPRADRGPPAGPVPGAGLHVRHCSGSPRRSSARRCSGRSSRSSRTATRRA